MRNERLTLIQKGCVVPESETAIFRNFSIASTRVADCDLPEKTILDFDVVIANSLERRKACYQLAFDEYLKKGYVSGNSRPYIVNQFDLVEGSIVFAVQDSNLQTVGTLTIIPDSAVLLPSDMVFNQELNEMRANKLKIFEFSRLAIREDMKNQFDLLATLINYGALYAYFCLKADLGVIEVNPHHCGFYEKLLLAKRNSEIRYSPFVSDAPAILLALSTDEMLENTKLARDLVSNSHLKRTYFPAFFRDHSRDKILAYIEKAKKPISEEEVVYFGL